MPKRAASWLAEWRPTMWPISWAKTPGDFGLVFGDQQQAAIDVEIAAENGEGVYLFGVVEDLNSVADAGAVF